MAGASSLESMAAERVQLERKLDELTLKIRRRISAAVAAGESVSSVAAAAGVSRETVYQWLRAEGLR